MRTHTAMHILCGVIFRDYGASVTGGDMDPLQGRMDFEFETMQKELVQAIEAAINAEVAQARPVRTAILPRAQAFQIPDLIRTKINLLPEKDYGLQERFFDDLVFLVLGLLLCGIVLFFLGRGLDGQISALDRTIEKKNQIIADHEIIIKKVKEVEESRKTLEQQLNTINQLKEDKIGPVRMLEEFALPAAGRAGKSRRRRGSAAVRSRWRRVQHDNSGCAS